MCGFTGYIQKKKYIDNFHEIKSMNDSIKHRGPDDHGIVFFSFNNNHCESIYNIKDGLSDREFDGAIGFNRLSIIDLSKNGHQPMINKDNNIILCFNGEIYNANDFRENLINEGFVFKGKSDTEVLLYMYEYYGLEETLKQLNGMFAFCIINLKKKSVLLARDRLGIKPLYYYNNQKTFLFSSEVKSFLYNNSYESELKIDNIDEYLKFGYIAGKETLLKNVKNVEPGQYIVMKDSDIVEKYYWEIPNDDDYLDIDLNKGAKIVEDELVKSLKLRLISDVKIGCQLSGGVDSSLITLMTSENLHNYDLDSISIILNDKSLSEEYWINMSSEITGVNNRMFTLDDDYFSSKYKLATWHFDFPIMMPNSIGIFLLAEKAKKFFTVFLSGEGADELLAGYTRFHGAKILDNKLFYYFLKRIPYYKKYLQSWYVSTETQSDFNVPDWFISTASHLSLDMMMSLKNDVDLSKAMTKRREIFDSGNGDIIKNAQRYELKTWLVDLLIRQDKMTMANSIENRVPFLDHNMVELCRKIPTRLLTKFGFNTQKNTKIILKHITAKYFGKKFTYRPKAGFQLPLMEFFKENFFNCWVKDSILPGIKRRGIFDSKIIEKMFEQDVLNEEEIQSLWSMISFETWANMFLEKKSYQ